MPQMRSVISGISKNMRPSQNFSKPRNSFTWKTGLFDFPCVIQVDRDLGMAFDASHRLNHNFRTIIHLLKT